MMKPYTFQLPEKGTEIAQLKANVLSFNLDDGPRGTQGYLRVLLQLFGFSGHGKSSLVNSCKYVLDDGDFIEHAEAPQTQQGLTMIRRSYLLTDLITIVDNRGVDNFQRAKVYAQLGNLLPLDCNIEWQDNEEFTNVLDHLDENEVDYKDLIVPVFVYSVSQTMEEGDAEDARTFLKNCKRMTGVWPIIVLTNKMSGDWSGMERKFRLMGAEEVIAIENYTPQDNRKSPEKNAAILTFIVKALDNVRFCMNLPRNPKQDHISHRKFVLQNIHDAILDKQDDEWLEKKSEEQLLKQNNCHIM